MCVYSTIMSKSGENGVGASMIGLSAPSFLTVKNSPIYSGIIELGYNNTPLPITSGGTGLTAIGSEGQVLSVVSTDPTPQLGWISPSGLGSVTDVRLSLPSFLESSTSSITSSGTFDISYSDTPLPITSGGTGFTAVGPPGNILSSDGSNYSWVEPHDGTVTSVSITLPSFLESKTSSITTSGTFDISYSDTPLPISSGGTGLRTLGEQGQVLSSTDQGLEWIDPAKGTVSSVALTLPSFLTTSTPVITSTGSFDINYSDTPLPISSGGTGLSTIGSKDQILASDGTSIVWKDPSAATVSSVGLDTRGASFLTCTGPITSSGTISLEYSSLALPISSGGTGLTTVGLKDQILTSDGTTITWDYPKEIDCIKSISAVYPLKCTDGPTPEISLAMSTGSKGIVLSESPTITSPTLIEPLLGNARASSLTFGTTTLTGSGGSYNLILPNSIGRVGQVLTSQGPGKLLTWTSPVLPFDSISIDDTSVTTLKPLFERVQTNIISQDTLLTPTTLFQFQTISTSRNITLTSPSAKDIVTDTNTSTMFQGTLLNADKSQITWTGGRGVYIFDGRISPSILVQSFIVQIIDTERVNILLK